VGGDRLLNAAHQTAKEVRVAVISWKNIYKKKISNEIQDIALIF
jgi:hypothetical protein